MADDAGDLIGHRIAVRHDGIIVASEQLDATDLIDESVIGVDAAGAVLVEIASVATRLVTTATSSTTPADRGPLSHGEVSVASPKSGWVQGFPIRSHHRGGNPPNPSPTPRAAPAC